MYEHEKSVVKEWCNLMVGQQKDILDGYSKMFAQNATWTLIGTTPMSGTHVGIEAILQNNNLAFSGDGRPGSKEQGLDSAAGLKVTVKEIVALEDGRILVLAKTRAQGKNGVPYAPDYAWIFRVTGNKIVEWVEYCDTVNIETAMFNKKLVPTEELTA